MFYKYLVGGSIVFFVILIIWFPLLLMNLVLTIAGVPNNPSALEIKVSVDTFEVLPPFCQFINQHFLFQPLMSVSIDNSSIRSFNNSQFNHIKQKFYGDQVILSPWQQHHNYCCLVTASTSVSQWLWCWSDQMYIIWRKFEKYLDDKSTSRKAASL